MCTQRQLYFCFWLGYFLPCLILLVVILSTMLNRSGKVSILVLFPVLEEKILAFHHWVWCLLWTCHKWLLLCWGKFPLYLFCCCYHKWMLIFFKYFAFLWDNYMIFILHFVTVMYHIDWFVVIKPFLHAWNKSNMIMMYDPFNILFNSVL